MTEGRCSGHCCRAFTLPVDPDGLRRGLELWIAREEDDRPRARELLEQGTRFWGDIELIATMAVAIGQFERNPLAPDLVPNEDAPPLQWFYRCRHHDAASGDCTIYEDRPEMCRSYPYGDPCPFPGCTYVPGPDPIEVVGGWVQLHPAARDENLEYVAPPTALGGGVGRRETGAADRLDIGHDPDT